MNSESALQEFLYFLENAEKQQVKLYENYCFYIFVLEKCFFFSYEISRNEI